VNRIHDIGAYGVANFLRVVHSNLEYGLFFRPSRSGLFMNMKPLEKFRTVSSGTYRRH